MIALSGVSVEYPQSRPLSELDAVLDADFTAIVGPSGSGKSTLLRVLAGTQEPDAGTVEVDGVAVRTPSWARAGDERVALVHQDYRLIEFLDVGDNLRLAAELRGIDASEDELVAALEQVALSADFLPRLPGTLSGGEQQRVALARGLVSHVRVLLADEPTGALDADNTERVTGVLRALSRIDGVQVVVATHDPLVARGGDVVFALSDGELVRTR